ncbi:uncharacterized protein LOC113348115 [Papaver somniferum]|uniref:uncharacterized protein LOC113348115 n=1 Tax=Papaver somniferum TaxID=3469 RepID=UPI000E7017D8|nr:uncharacterized protein LOC113348115 [Papaver somniferum]
MGKALGRPIKVDETTLKREARYYESSFVEIDLVKPIPSKIWVESKYGGFEQAVQIPKLPKFCNHCQVIGHYVAECRTKRRESMPKDVEPNANEVRKVWRKVTHKRIQHPVQVGFDICNTPSSKDKLVENIKDILNDKDEEVDAPHIQLFQPVEDSSLLFNSEPKVKYSSVFCKKLRLAEQSITVEVGGALVTSVLG